MSRSNSRPLHPMLVVFPLALYAITVGALLIHIGSGDPFWFRLALMTDVIAVAAALAAILPGSLDLVSLRLSRAARALGIRHAALSLTATVLFALCGVLLWHGWSHRMMVDGEFVLDATIPLAVAVMGLLGAIAAGMLGWTLAETHQVRPMIVPIRSLPDPDDAEDHDDGLAYQTPAHSPHDTERNLRLS